MTDKDWLRIGNLTWKKNKRGTLHFLNIFPLDTENWIVDLKLPYVPGNPFGGIFSNKNKALVYAKKLMRKF